MPRPANTGYYEKTAPGGPESNAPESFIANLEEAPAHTPAHYIKLSARSDGSFVVTNSRTSFSKEYRARAAGENGAVGAADAEYHHIHLNSNHPQRSLDRYPKDRTAGKITTVAGFPAFEGGDGCRCCIRR